ncbi:Dihydroorotate dehydrogenase B (NAD(+)), electron transfer subunit [Porphyromonas levii]|nr:Dihydroorotate dehydrogenase B (NAD(+)), electron transfer subunit [Porphyromonas levii]
MGIGNRMKKDIFDIEMELVGREVYSDRLFLGHFAPTNGEQVVPICLPGQFVEIQVKNCDGVMLRRPISVYAATERTLDLLIQNAGKGTEVLCNAPVGSRFNILLPLGNTFRIPEAGARPLLVGGGVGVAPMYALGCAMKAKGIEPTFLLGARSAGHFSDLSHFESVGELFITTEDASLGEQGYVTQHSILRAQKFTHIYVCGPTPMMKAVARWAREEGIPSQASLENHMACGIGVCLCCVEPTVKGHKTVCNDGPVFDTTELLWD